MAIVNFVREISERHDCPRLDVSIGPGCGKDEKRAWLSPPVTERIAPAVTLAPRRPP